MTRLVKTENDVPMDPRWQHLPFYNIDVASINMLLDSNGYLTMMTALNSPVPGYVRAVGFRINEGSLYDTNIMRYYFDNESHMAIFKLQFSMLRYVTIPSTNISKDR